MNLSKAFFLMSVALVSAPNAWAFSGEQVLSCKVLKARGENVSSLLGLKRKGALEQVRLFEDPSSVAEQELNESHEYPHSARVSSVMVEFDYSGINQNFLAEGMLTATEGYGVTSLLFSNGNEARFETSLLTKDKAKMEIRDQQGALKATLDLYCTLY